MTPRSRGGVGAAMSGAVRAATGLPVVGPSVRRAAILARHAGLAAAPMPIRSHHAYQRAVSTGPLELSPASVGSLPYDSAATPSVAAVSARGRDTGIRLAALRAVRDELVRTHATPYELVHAVLEGDAAVAFEAARRPAVSSFPAMAGRPVVLDARSWPEASGADPLPLLRAVRRAAADREVVALVGTKDGTVIKGVADGALADSSLVDRVETVPDRLVRTWPSAVVALDTLGAPAPALARFAALKSCVSIGVVHDLSSWERPRDAADWLRQQARAALLRDLDLVLAADASVAADVVRWLGVARDRVVVLAGRPPDAASTTARGGGRTVHCLASGRRLDDVPAVVTAAAAATAVDRVNRRVVIHGPLPPGGQEPLDRLIRDLGPNAPLVEVADDDVNPVALRTAPAVAEGDTVVDASHDGHHVRRAVALAAGVVPVVAVQNPASVDVLGDGPWLINRRAHSELARLLATEQRGTSVPARQLATAVAAARSRAADVARAVDRAIGAAGAELSAAGSGGPRRAPSTLADGRRPTTVVLSSPSGGELFDHLLSRAFEGASDVAPAPLLAAVEPDRLARALGRPVTSLDASLFVRDEPGDVLVAVTDNRADLVGLAVAEAYGVPLLTAEAALFAIHVDSRGPHATVPLVAVEGAEPTPHELVVLRMAGSRPAGTGMAQLSRQVRSLLVTSEATRQHVQDEGGEATTVDLPSLPHRVAENPGSVPRAVARNELGVEPAAMVVACLARAGDPSRTADRVVAAAGWLTLWGRPVTVLLPSWLPADERRRLARLAGEVGCDRAPVHVDHPGGHGVDLLVSAGDVIVHLGGDGEGPGLEELWTAGRPAVTTVAPASGGADTRVVAHHVTPLLLAEEILALVDAGQGSAVPPTRAVPEASGAGLSLDDWAGRILRHVGDSA